jgi:hypothetical protein
MSDLSNSYRGRLGDASLPAKTEPGDPRSVAESPGSLIFELSSCFLTAWLVLGCLGAAHYELASEELFIVQLLDGALRFVDRLHLHEGKAFRPLVVPVAYDLGVLNVSDAVKQLEQIALSGVKRQVADVEPG